MIEVQQGLCRSTFRKLHQLLNFTALNLRALNQISTYFDQMVARMRHVINPKPPLLRRVQTTSVRISRIITRRPSINPEDYSLKGDKLQDKMLAMIPSKHFHNSVLVEDGIAQLLRVYAKTFENNDLIKAKSKLISRMTDKSLDRKSGSAGMPRPISYAVFCLKKKN
eukprot:TRINITY_DN11655_c0_g1_i1.p1 TRINITY_DN11655_c0_g1~~TRINITY_DN11655_c0_g1_i1.p1  ORF type:complete len:189 (+),score=22.11 TRINITY_DN11655_c0_g1_i1:68-568(+)